MKIKEAISFGIDALTYGLNLQNSDDTKRQIENDVYFLLSSLLGKNISFIKTNYDFEMNKKDEEKYKTWLAKRLSLEPVQYITGETEFFSLDFYVGKGVLIPRQDTETIIEIAEKHFKDKNNNYLFLDMCCGSGCIGISLLKTFPNSKCVFVDKYKTPLEYTLRNIKRHNLENRSIIIESDLFTVLDDCTKFDAILCNPPYIAPEELKSISLQITLFEPLEALKGGSDGLYYYRQLADSASKFLKPSAPLLVEIGYNQAKDVEGVLKNWSKTQVFNDLAKNPRVLKAFK